MNRKSAFVSVFAAVVASLFLQSACKQERLFIRLDSLPKVPSQVHFFNNFAYDSVLNLSIDGVFRETVPYRKFSKYYPSLNKFTTDGSGNVKAISLEDPTIPGRYSDTTFYQFKPGVSYLGFTIYPFYQLNIVNGPKEVKKPTTVFVPEDLAPPYPGLVKVRLINSLAGVGIGNAILAPIRASGQLPLSLTITPDQGQGTRKTVSAQARLIGSVTSSTASDYQLTQPGNKLLTLRVNGFIFSYQETYLAPTGSYSLIAVGDPVNYLLGREPPPQLFKLEDGKPEALNEVTFQSVQKINSDEENVNLFVSHGAYNIPDTISTNPGSTFKSGLTGINITINNLKLTSDQPGYLFGTFNTYDVLSFDKITATDIGIELSSIALSGHRNRRFSVFPPVTAPIKVRSTGSIDPLFNDPKPFAFEAGKQYRLFTVPRSQTELKCDIVIDETDPVVDPKSLKVRVANMLYGSGSIDVRLDDEHGKVLVQNVPFGSVSDYVLLPGDPQTRRLVLCPSGQEQNILAQFANTNPFGQPANTPTFSLPFKGGNNGTLLLIGSVLPTHLTNRYNLTVERSQYYYTPQVQYLQEAYFYADQIINTAFLFPAIL